MSCNRFGIGLNPKTMLYLKARLPGGTYTGKHLTVVCQCLVAYCQHSLPQHWAVPRFVLLRVQTAQKDQLQSMGAFAINLKGQVNRYMSRRYTKLTSVTACCSGRPNSPWTPKKYINHQTVSFDLFRVPLSRYRLFIFIPWNLSR